MPVFGIAAVHANSDISLDPVLKIEDDEAEADTEVTSLIFFTDNDDFWGGKKKEQEMLSSVQTHVVKIFKNRIWGSVSAGYDWGGGDNNKWY